LLVVNNWTECEIGFEATSRTKWVRLYFLFFHVLAVILVNNGVIAFIISQFLTQMAIFKESTDAEFLGDTDDLVIPSALSTKAEWSKRVS
jgi:hypothetical protein